jgi:hypothetical protein
MSNKKDFATSTVLTAPSPATSGTSLVIQSGHGARFPTAPFYVTAHPPSEFPTLDNAEKLLVSSKSTDTFTIARGEADTDAKPIEAGWRISNALFLDDIPDTFDDLTDGTTNKAFTSTLKTKLDGIEASADVTDATNVDAAGATMNADTNVKSNSWVVDEDTLSSNVDTKVPTQQSVKAYVDAAITAAKAALLPVGSIVVLGVSTDPATLYGFGTWTAIATGKVIVGKAASGTFSTLDATGGSETHTLSVTEMPSHTHTQDAHNHLVTSVAVGATRNYTVFGTDAGIVGNRYTDSSTATNQNTGGGGAHNNLQPYIVKYMWQRTA